MLEIYLPLKFPVSSWFGIIAVSLRPIKMYVRTLNQETEYSNSESNLNLRLNFSSQSGKIVQTLIQVWKCVFQFLIQSLIRHFHEG